MGIEMMEFLRTCGQYIELPKTIRQDTLGDIYTLRVVLTPTTVSPERAGEILDELGDTELVEVYEDDEEFGHLYYLSSNERVALMTEICYERLKSNEMHTDFK